MKLPIDKAISRCVEPYRSKCFEIALLLVLCFDKYYKIVLRNFMIRQYATDLKTIIFMNSLQIQMCSVYLINSKYCMILLSACRHLSF